MNDTSSQPEPGKLRLAVTTPDRIPAGRYYDQDFFELEKKHLWPKVWQMAARLEEIPEVGDYAVYRNLDQSVIVIRTSESEIKAYQNHCRHRGVELVQKRGKARGGFICPFHGWRWDKDGNSTFVYEDTAFSAENMCQSELNLVPVRLETWMGCAFINFDDNASPLRETLGEFGRKMDRFKAEHLRAEWWLAARLGDQRRDADTQIYIVAIAKFACGSARHFIPGPGHQAVSSRTVTCSMRFSFNSDFMSRCTNTPGVWMVSGSSVPGSTICSTSATVIRPQVATIGLKFLADFR